jgi:hypothetical protein
VPTLTAVSFACAIKLFAVSSNILTFLILSRNNLFPIHWPTDISLLTYLIRSSYTFTVSKLFFHFDHCTNGRTPWMSDHFVARPLPRHRTTQTQNKHIHIPKIHALCGIRTHDPGFRGSEDSTRLSYRDRPYISSCEKSVFGLLISVITNV